MEGIPKERMSSIVSMDFSEIPMKSAFWDK